MCKKRKEKDLKVVHSHEEIVNKCVRVDSLHLQKQSNIGIYFNILL